MEQNTFFKGSPIPPEELKLSSEPKPRINIFSRKFLIGVVIFLIFLFAFIRFVIPLFVSVVGFNRVTITYWGLWEDENVMKGVIDEFQKKNPNIKVDYIEQDKNQYRKRLVTRINNGTGPDVFRFHNTWVPMLSSVLLPVPSDIINPSTFQKNYYPVIQQDLMRNGAIYGVPLEIDTLALFVNTKMLQDAGYETPDTWDEFIEVATALTVREEGKIKIAGAAMGTTKNVTHAPDIISVLLLQNGVDLYKMSSSLQNVNDALRFYNSFIERGIWDPNLDPSVRFFAENKLAMYFGFSWDVFTILAINKDISFKIYPVPHLSGRNMTIASYWAEGVSVGSQNQREALKFLQFLSERDTSIKFFTESSKTRQFGEPYARIDLAESLRNNPLVYPFVMQAPNAVSSFFASDTYDEGLNDQMNQYLENAVNSFSGFSGDTAAEGLANGVSEVLKQYGQQ
ncbi:MAG: sugar ABC transporter substrate-binding protein [Candidatus Levybacteria bacterium]|nr:sugar ABC transporter substrate-binding protein [Candidatus Levybacteria bacterium]